MGYGREEVSGGDGGGVKEQISYGGEEVSGVDWGGGGLKSRWGMVGRRYQEHRGYGREGVKSRGGMAGRG